MPRSLRAILSVVAGLTLVAGFGSLPSYAGDEPLWTQQASPNDPAGFTTRLDGVSCWSDGCMAVGRADQLEQTVPFAVRKQGSASWSATPYELPPGTSGEELDAVSCPSADHCLAVGEHGGSVPGPLGLEWDGTGWHRQPPVDSGEDYPFNGTTYVGSTHLRSISCPDDGTCIAVGDQTAAEPTQVSNAGSGGGSVAMAQEWTATTGDFVSPVAGTTVTGQPTDSPHGYYSATWDTDAHTVQVTRHLKTGDRVILTAPGMFGGFSPDDDRFVTESLDGEVATVFLYNLKGTEVSTATYTESAAVTSSRLAWSPSGHYLFFGFTNATQTFLQIADATAMSAADQRLFDTGGLSPIPPPGGGKELHVAAYGFGPDDSRFMYAFLSAADQVTWRWVDLAEDPDKISTIQTDGSSGFAQFSPDAQALGLVDAGSGSISTYLLDTRTGAMLGSVGPASANGQIKLRAESDNFVAAYGTASYTLAANRYRSWHSLDVPVPETPAGLLFSGWHLQSVSCVTASDCVAVGSYFGFDASARVANQYAVIERWDGTKWTLDHFDSADGTYLQGVSCLRAGCMAVGNALKGTLVMRTDGHGGWSSGHAVDVAGDPSERYTAPLGVTCTATDACTMIGLAYGADETFPFAQTYADGAWSDDQVSHFDGSGFNVLDAVATGPGGDPVAVGTYLPSSDGFQQSLAMVRHDRSVTPPQPRPIRQLSAPGITGQAHLGSPLTAHPGRWSPADATYSYQWLRDGSTIAGATAVGYRPVAADVGHRLAVRVTATRSGFVPARATSPATSPVTVTPTMRVRARRGKHRIRVVVVVGAAGVAHPTGKVRITARIKGRSGTRRLGVLRLRNGRAATVVKHLPKGRYILTVRYRGAGPVLPASATAKTKVT